MPYRGRPSKNCADCRRRKIKCDLKLPGCTQCSNAGLPCTGYRNQLDLMFLDENERTERSVLKRSKASATSSAKNNKASDTDSSAPSRRSSPGNGNAPGRMEGRGLQVGSSSWRTGTEGEHRRTPSAGPPPNLTRANERKKSRTATPEESDRSEASMRAASKAASRRAASQSHHNTPSTTYLQPYDSAGHPMHQHPHPHPHFHNTPQQPHQHQRSQSPFDFTYETHLGFDVASTTASTGMPGTPYSQGSSRSIPSINMPSPLPLQFSLNISEPLAYLPTSSSASMAFLAASAPGYGMLPAAGTAGPQMVGAAGGWQAAMGVQNWDCGQWVEDVDVQIPPQAGGLGMGAGQGEWLGWEFGGEQGGGQRGGFGYGGQR